MKTSLLKRLDFSGKSLTDGIRLVDSRYYTGTDFYASAQGITNDGQYYYCTGTVLPLGFRGLSKIDMQTGEVLLKDKYQYLVVNDDLEAAYKTLQGIVDAEKQRSTRYFPVVEE